MDDSQKQTKRTYKSRRFEKLLRDELKGGVVQQIVAQVNPRLAEYVAALQRQGGTVTVARAINLAQIIKALQGDLKAYETIRDTIGEKPGDGADTSRGVLKVVVEDAGNC